MANKSQVVVDADALEELIIGVNRLKQLTDDNSAKITKVASDMTEVLSGTDNSELLIDSFQDCARGAQNLQISADSWVKTLDRFLDQAYGLKPGTIGQAVKENSDKNAKSMGILKNAAASMSK